MTLNSLLFTAGPVVKFDGRFFIVAGQPGFNLFRNNCGGFSSRKAALSAIRRHTRTA